MKQWVMIAAVIGGFALQSAASASADYPVRPNGNDVIARILAETMSRTLGQQIIVENRPGAGGTIGTRQLAKSPPDGYTLVMGSTGTVAMAPSVFPNVGYDPRIARSAIVLVLEARNQLFSPTPKISSSGESGPSSLTKSSPNPTWSMPTRSAIWLM